MRVHDGSRELVSDRSEDLRWIAAITIHNIEITIEPKILLVVIFAAVRSISSEPSARRPELVGLKKH
jgi:hypothetical protein